MTARTCGSASIPFPKKSRRTDPYAYNRIALEQVPEKYILISNYTPCPVDRKLLTETLKTAIYQARTSHMAAFGDTALGLSSFDALAEMLVWDESFEPLTPAAAYEGDIRFPYDRPDGYYRTDGARTLDARFWEGYCDYLCMLNGYDNFSRFLNRYADTEPAWRDALREAAEYYDQACFYSGALWNYVTPDSAGAAKFKQKDVRYAFAAHMLRAKIYTVKAVEILEKLVS